MDRTLAVCFLAGILAALATAEEDTGASRGRAAPAQAPASAQATPSVSAPDVPHFVPPARGAPRTRVGAGTRSQTGVATPVVEVLSPEEVGHTLSETPSLYWYVSAATPVRIDFTLIDESSVAPLVEKTLPGPFPAGVHRIELESLGVRLAPQKEYQWFVSLVPDAEERSSDLVAGGGVALVDAGPVREQLASAEPGQQAFVLARNGIWYDAIDTLSRRIEQAPADPLPREQRAALLEQVGLERVAAAERAAH